MPVEETCDLQPIVDMLATDMTADGKSLKSDDESHIIYLPNGNKIPCKKIKAYYTGSDDFICCGGRVSGNLYIVIAYDIIAEEMNIYLVDGQRLNPRIGSLSAVLKESEFELAIKNIIHFEDIEGLFEPYSTAIFKRDVEDDRWIEQVK